MPPTIRPAARDDFDAIAAIANDAIRSGVAHFGTEPVATDELVAEWAEGRSGYPWFVATDGPGGGPVLAYAKAGPWKTRGAYRWTTEVGIYVREGDRGLGLGRALYDRLFPELERRGFRTLLAGVTVPNPASERLHEAMGMRRVGVLPRVGFKHGAWHDVAYYARHYGTSSTPADLPDALSRPAPPPHQ